MQDELEREVRDGKACECEVKTCPTCHVCDPCLCPVCPVFDDTSTQKLPCPNDCNSAGSCNPTTGTCTCTDQHVGKDCSLPDTDSLRDLVTVLLPTSKSGGIPSRTAWLNSIKKKYKDRSPKVLACKEGVHAEEDTDERDDDDVTYLDDDRVRAGKLGSELNALLHEATTELVLVVTDSTHLSKESDLDMAVTMFKETSVDILGGITEAPDHLLNTPCYDLVHKRWELHHRRPPFGYRRHERFMMYCDTTSSIFLARKSVLLRLKGFNESYSGMSVISDLFLRVKQSNNAIAYQAKNSTSAYHRLADVPTRLPGYIFIGVGAEVIFPIAGLLEESFTRNFAERHQIEAYHDRNGKQVGNVICIKTGGNLQHSVDGRYAPLCHRLTRQRDFTFIYDLWMSEAFQGVPIAPPRVSSKKHRFGVSVHHGNLFGALRMGEELLWETDGDFDLVSFNYTNAQLISKGQKLVDKLHENGFSVRMPHMGKLTYLNVLKNKTDFQISLRSTNDPNTAGKPPHQHTVLLRYQGRDVYVNGFSNPWKGIKSDKGHDYREQYLAQQPWVLHFTSESIGCKGGFHNACLPPCNSPTWRMDHNYCSDDDLSNAHSRNPFLWNTPGEKAWKEEVAMYR